MESSSVLFRRVVTCDVMKGGYGVETWSGVEWIAMQ